MPLLTSLAERLPLPDTLVLKVIDKLCGQTERRLMRTPDDEAAFAAAMTDYPVATHTDDANRQHYELPPAFFGLILGRNRKYSCAFYPETTTTLDEAEAHALSATCDHADLADGQHILELGCGWGSLSLWMAAAYPRARIVSVSNSAPQRDYIMAEAARRGLTNLTVLTADMNSFNVDVRFDRIVSVEMFEHMSNWRELLRRARNWLSQDGRLFLHVFTHRSRSYRFEMGKGDWIADHFFTGGLMPARDLPQRFNDLFEVEAEWHWSGTHYRRTALDWLQRFDAQSEQITPLLKAVYGGKAGLWRRRWRLFFLATAGLWGHADGQVWGVGHYRLKPAANG